MNKQIEIPKTLHRSGGFEPMEDGSMRLSISSDVPYLRYDYRSGEEYYEVLDHTPGAVDMSRLEGGAPLLFNHDRNVLIGTLNNPKCTGGRCYVNARISEAPDVESYRVKVKEGILKDTSIGYSITSDGTPMGKKDGKPVYKFKFAVHEASLVTIPADTTVGVGRQRSEENGAEKVVIAIDLQKDIDETPEIVQTQTTGNNAPTKKSMSEQIEAPKIDIVAERAKWENESIARRKQFDEFCDTVAQKRNIDVRPLAKEYLDGDKRAKSFDDFRQEVFVGEFKAVPVNTNGEIPGVTEKEVKRFSVIKALRDMAQGGRLEGLEREMCAAAQKELRRDLSKAGAFILPAEVTRHFQMEQFMQRAQSAGVFSAGGATVAQEMQGLIEFLRNQTVLGKLGITILSGLVGDLVFPVQTGGATAYWVSETGALTDSEATFGNKTMTPHRLGATIPLTTQLLAQSSISMENWVRTELDTVTALKADAAGLQGTGVAGEPLGVANTTGINATVTFGGAATWEDVVEFETGIATDNAIIGEMKFALSTAAVGKWKTILRSSVAGASYLILDNMTANGYTVERTNQIAGNIAFFGVWAQLLRGIWAGREIIVDPYALKKSGQIEVTVNEMTDFLCRQPASFNVSTDSAAQ